MVVVLTAEKHARIIADMEHVCATAGITPLVLQTTAKGVAHDKAIEWLKSYRTTDKAGLMLIGRFPVDPATQFCALTGALVRNYIDARVRTLTDVLGDEGDLVDAEVLLIPDFCERTTVGGSGVALTQWQVRTLHSLLLSRITRGKQTVVHVDDFETLTKVYGHAMADMLIGHYVGVKP